LNNTSNWLVSKEGKFMKQKIVWKKFAILAVSIMSSSAFADYSKSFDGYNIFRTNCSVCHGFDGTGNGPLASKLDTKPADLTNNDRLKKKSDRELFKIIEGKAPHGQVSSDMPQWGLAIPQTQIRSLLTYIRYLHSSKHPVSGNPQMGKQVYENNCSICHGPDGKGKGAITKVFDMEPADHTDASSMNLMSNEKIHSIISHGTKGAKLMPGWKDILSDKEIEDVISYIRLLSAK
jgi:cbb3-type cytochrome c oxidase subunit III